MKVAVPVTVPPLIDPAVTERRVHVKRGDQDQHLTLKPDDAQFELIQPTNSPELTVTISDFTPAGEGPESDPITVKFDGSDFPPPKPGALHAMRATGVDDSVASIPDFGDVAPAPDQPAPAPDVTPAPAPDVTPTPAPAPDITPTPAPAPDVTPAPAPDVTPAPAPDVTPTPAPAPDVTPAPAPDVTPAPAPDVTPAPAPDVTPAPAPDQPAPAPMPDLPPA